MPNRKGCIAAERSEASNYVPLEKVLLQFLISKAE
jgi:hypothetical protein